MNIAIIGSGNIGSGLAFTFGQTAYSVSLASHHEESARQVANKLAKDNISAVSIADAVKGADVVILATPYEAISNLASSIDFSGKVVVDVTNPVKADFSGLSIGFDTSAAEEIQTLLPKAKVVKAFNTVFAQVYEQGLEFAGNKAQTFVAADDDAAKQTVLTLANEAGFDAVDAGALSNARYLEPLAYMNIHFGYMLGKGTQIIPAWLSR
ncbi:F420-dependent NADP oxidoreductase [Vibrio sp. CAIM 722]|uniref:F420-dependent NADP oxidoreductase n=1 Tax=Vibrio eleionomae TaxID=2653505 RepID=A0A7X4LQT6_9VIBR|nr:NADPH-dependent F420 reductase [Vibrio eleionomae]MZI96091.1 F420-dependent NADP oxidoreductase [Vibrio eleionomae]